jgi:hypothetical protein
VLSRPQRMSSSLPGSSSRPSASSFARACVRECVCLPPPPPPECEGCGGVKCTVCRQCGSRDGTAQGDAMDAANVQPACSKWECGSGGRAPHPFHWGVEWCDCCRLRTTPRIALGGRPKEPGCVCHLALPECGPSDDESSLVTHAGPLQGRAGCGLARTSVLSSQHMHPLNKRLCACTYLRGSLRASVTGSERIGACG